MHSTRRSRLDRGALPPARAMQGWDAVRAAFNPFAIAQRPKVPTGRGPGRQIVFAVDSSKYRCVLSDQTS